ncbi:gliding motility-associated peptidyl-prolyl isomerase GldI [Aureitalea marina]|uniref:Peptidyl-prolyl cis-trans isomerase n=1 Tax=Aureitalea marina TaxID=930804 RepID=A0A2S7KQ12_9FLAO|nr:gliding motility-associated peptidyl-prolyl isomerase GldI [Aureitalea marina]PQB04701.1 gliding motility-associated peptidyl-prolyl isomerase GldI [Aureitalea marina]
MTPIRFMLMLLLIIGIGSCGKPEARKPVSRATGSYIQQSAERNKELYAQEKLQLQQLVAQDSSRNYQSSPNGFWYTLIQRDTTQSGSPRVGDLVSFSYDILSLEGDTLISRSENGVISYSIDQSNQELISGIREGLKVMQAGDVTQFLFPSYLAYGYYGSQGAVNPNQMVRSTIELYSIEKKESNN